MITLRIIFYGLIAFAPGAFDDGTMAAISIDPASVEDGHVHETRIWQYESVRKRLTPIIEPQTGEVVFKNRYLSIRELANQPPAVTENFRNAEDSQLEMVPRGKNHFRDISWIPVLEDIEPYAGGLISSTLWAPPEYLNSIFKIGGGTLIPCHVVHEDGKENKIRIFRFKAKGENDTTSDPKQSIADAVMLEMEIKNTSVTLLSQTLGQISTEDIVLRPKNGEKSITIVIANTKKLDEGDCTLEGEENWEKAIDHHFGAFYNLTHYFVKASEWRLPHEEESQSVEADLQICEAEITALKKNLDTEAKGTFFVDQIPEDVNCVDVTPHSAQICSPSMFSYVMEPSSDQIFGSINISETSTRNLTSPSTSTTTARPPRPTDRNRPVTGIPRRQQQPRP